MSQGSRNRFVVEGLEHRNLLSASVAADLLSASLDTGVPTRHAASLSAPLKHTVTPVVATPQVKAVVGTTPLLGAFNIAGTYTRPFSRNPDAGVQYLLTGSGRKRTLGSFSMTGNLQSPGFIATARARGYATLTSSQGTIDLRLLGPEQPPGSLPPTLAFKIVGGSGAYANAYGKGAILVSASDTTQKFLFRFNQ
jgi:hypothetical protein